MFGNARRQEYDSNDLYKPLPEHKSDVLGDQLCEAWDAELKQAKEKNRKPSLLRVTMRVFGLEFVLLGLWLFTLEILLR